MVALWPRHPSACNLVDEVRGVVSMKIAKVQSGGLRGATPEGGWSNEIKPDDCIHTLIAVYTDEGVTGWGSGLTNDALVAAALKVLEPLFMEKIQRARTCERESFMPIRSGWDVGVPSRIPLAASISQCGGHCGESRRATGG